MRIHLEPELQGEKLKKPATVSVACHAALFVLIAVWGYIRPEMRIGDPGGDEGSAVSVNLVQGVKIPVPISAPNPVANPVEHEVPAVKERPKPAAPEKTPEPEPEAVPVEEPKKTAPKPVPEEKEQKSAPEKPDNQISSTTGQRASSEVFESPSEAIGGVGVSGRDPFGQAGAAYARRLQEALSREWAKTLGQVSGNRSNAAVVQFKILKNGSIRDIRIVQSSGNRSFDYSVHRAVQYTNPFQPLPVLMRRSVVSVEMRFQLSQ